MPQRTAAKLSTAMLSATLGQRFDFLKTFVPFTSVSRCSFHFQETTDVFQQKQHRHGNNRRYIFHQGNQEITGLGSQSKELIKEEY